MKDLIIGFTLGLAAVTYVSLLTTINHVGDTRKDTIYAICNQARVSATISERECGTLQDKWGYEFACWTNGTDPISKCWVEKK